MSAHVCILAQVQTYAEAFAKIQQHSGITDYDELVTTFINAEDENYRLYKYIDELTQENARLEEQILDISVRSHKICSSCVYSIIPCENDYFVGFCFYIRRRFCLALCRRVCLALSKKGLNLPWCLYLTFTGKPLIVLIKSLISL
jgi:hypothetical protein